MLSFIILVIILIIGYIVTTKYDYVMSFFKNNFVSKKPNGMEPIKYENNIIKNICIIKP